MKKKKVEYDASSVSHKADLQPRLKTISDVVKQPHKKLQLRAAAREWIKGLNSELKLAFKKIKEEPDRMIIISDIDGKIDWIKHFFEIKE
jgi:hypothetical protein